MKKIVSIVLILTLVLTAFAACGKSKKAENEDIEFKVQGTGNSANKELSVQIFGSTITLGKTTVQDLLDDGWGQDPESWKDVDLEKEIEYKKDSVSGKEMDKRGIEVTIGFENLTGAFVKMKDCTINSLRISGFANFDACDFRILDYVAVTEDLQTFENDLKANCSEYNYKESKSEYSTFKYYDVTLESGTIDFDFIVNNEDQATTDATIDLRLNYDYSIQK